MKIAYIITRIDPSGGAYRHVHGFSTAMKAAGHDVIVLFGEKDTHFDLRDYDLPVYSINHLQRSLHPGNDIRALIEITTLLRRLNPDLVSAHSSKAGWLGRLAANFLRLPVIFTAHGWAFSEGVPGAVSLFYRFAERFAARFADRIITVSDYDRDLALRYRLCAPMKIVTVHNGVPDIPPALAAMPSVQPPRLAMVARFQKPKDHRTLLLALADLQGIPWSLDLIGDGPLRAESEELAASLGLKDRVRFLGARDDVATLLATTQIFILTSHWEGFPLSILEAMRAGLPVVASNVGGVRESVIDGITGYLIPRNDSSFLRARLKRLIGDPALRLSMGQRGRQRYENEFTFAQMFAKTNAIYEEVTRQRSIQK